ncbi:MAG: hypothetical protein LBK56_14050 [Gracilibacteraceae bacterium]|jgi:hypothetical protein|nr:hypothetical protein [Gracilibacteraceae bacterium]
MGQSGRVLFTKEDFVSGEEIIEQLSRENSAFSFHLRFIDETGYKNYPTVKHAVGNISNSDRTNQLIIYIYAHWNPSKYLDFEWDAEGYYTSIYIEDVGYGDQVLLPFLLHLLRLYPRAKVWIDYDWFYTLADLELLATRLDRREVWYEVNPKEFYL